MLSNWNTKKLLLTTIVTFFVSWIHAEINDEYALSTGSDDYRRLQYLNSAVNPYSLKFIKKYVKNGDNVLDIGCGPGILAEQISKLVGTKGKVFGVDNNADQISIAKRNAVTHKIKNVNYKVLDAGKLGQLKEKFDVAYIRFVLIHLKDPNKVISEVKKVLKPGGYILVEELEGNNTIMSVPKDLRLELVKKIDGLQEEIQRSDFSIGLKFGKSLNRGGFTVLKATSVHPKLDTLPKRRNFSLGMRSLEKSLVENDKISRAKLNYMIRQVEKLENNSKIDLYFYKIGQIAAVYQESGSA